MASPKTPTSKLQDEDLFQLPDTPASLTSEFNHDVLSKQTDNDQEELSPDSIEPSQIRHNEKIKLIAAPLWTEKFSAEIDAPESINTSTESGFSNCAKPNELIEKWLDDRKRWDSIQNCYETKITELTQRLHNRESSLKNKIENLTSNESQMKQKISELYSEISRYQSDNNSKQSTIRDLLEVKSDVTRQNSDLHSQLKGREEQIQKQQDWLNKANQDADTYQNKLRDEQKLHSENVSKLEQDLQPLKLENTRLGEQVSQLRISLRELQNNYNRQKSEPNPTSNAIIADHKIEIDKLKAELSTVKLQNETIRKESSHLKELDITSQNMVERLLKRLEQQIHASETLRQQLKTAEAKHEMEISRLEDNNAKLQNNLASLAKNAPSHSSSSADLGVNASDIVETLRYRCEKLNNENNSLRGSLDSMREQLGSVDVTKTSELQSHSKEMAHQILVIERLKTEIAQKDSLIHEIRCDWNAMQNCVIQHKSTINDLQNKIKDQTAEIDTYQSENQQLSQQFSILTSNPKDSPPHPSNEEEITVDESVENRDSLGCTREDSSFTTEDKQLLRNLHSLLGKFALDNTSEQRPQTVSAPVTARNRVDLVASSHSQPNTSDNSPQKWPLSARTLKTNGKQRRSHMNETLLSHKSQQKTPINPNQLKLSIPLKNASVETEPLYAPRVYTNNKENINVSNHRNQTKKKSNRKRRHTTTTEENVAIFSQSSNRRRLPSMISDKKEATTPRVRPNSNRNPKRKNADTSNKVASRRHSTPQSLRSNSRKVRLSETATLEPNALRNVCNVSRNSVGKRKVSRKSKPVGNHCVVGKPPPFK